MAILDSYSNSNSDGNSIVSIEYTVAQTFTITGSPYTITAGQFSISKYGSPTGSFYYKIYSLIGTFGSTAEPAIVIARSVAGNVASLVSNPTTMPSNHVGVPLAFVGVDLIPGNYALSIEYDGGNSSNGILVGSDSTAPSHPGNFADYYNGTWAAVPEVDNAFSISGDLVVSSNFLPFFA